MVKPILKKMCRQQGEFPLLLDADRKQVGVVVVGYAAPTLFDLFQGFKSAISVTMLLAILFSMAGAAPFSIESQRLNGSRYWIFE